MSTTATPMGTTAVSAPPTPKQVFLDAYDREHATTMRVLRAFPADQLELRPHAKCKSARELAWIFVGERQLGTAVLNNDLGSVAGPFPAPPESWDELLNAIEAAHHAYGDLVRSIPDDQMKEPVKFFVAPKTMGDIPRIDFVWFILHDEIHHRGQFSVYLRMADGKVPSIYGPTADEPWR
jgi:uncharacterized damage-inducible protein DinB